MQVSIREYARHRGCSHEAVRRAIQAGRLKRSVTKVGKATAIDVELADREWDANTDDTKQNNMGPQAKLERIPSLTQARAVRETYNARLAQLEYEEKSGTLCRVEDVKLQTFKTARLLRDALLNIPIRVVNEIAAMLGDLEPDKKHEILLILTREVQLALEQYTETDGSR
jgi:hypothetical protein